jgi:di/tricarboxylate transporter
VYTNFGITITYAQWLLVGIPFMLVMLGLIMLTTRIYTPDVTALRQFDIDAFRQTVKPLHRRGKVALGALVALFLLMVVPEALDAIGFGNRVTDYMRRMTVTT